jgi:hypothetical protein
MKEHRENTGLITAFATIAVTTMMAQHIAAKATRDALFLTNFDVALLPTMMMVSAVISIAVVVLMSSLLSRYGPSRLVPSLYILSAGLLGGQWLLVDTAPQITAIMLYLQVAALNSVLVSGFWSVINERFDPYSTKRVIAMLTAAASFGGILGGSANTVVASVIDTHAILLMLSAMHLVCAVSIAFLVAGQKYETHKSDAPTHILSPLKRSALIRSMALLAVFAATTVAVLDYILKAEASAALSHEDLIAFFSYLYMAVGLGSFLLQTVVGNKAFRWFGLGGTMAAWPLAILITGTGALLLRSLVTTTLTWASANLLYNSFYRAGCELLYTPIAPADKRTGKVLIDVGAVRSGDLVGGFIVMAILLLPMASETVLLLTALMMALICMALIFSLHRGYVHLLADNLRSGEIQANDLKVVDATTARTIATTQAHINRNQLLREIERTREKEAREAPPDEFRSVASADVITNCIIALRSDDVVRIKQTLVSYPMTPELLPHAIPLLQNGRVVREALRSMRKMASGGAGQMVDALIDPMRHPLVKRRLPIVLAYSDSPLAVEGLTIALDDSDMNVRFRCAQGLEAIRRRHPRLKANEERLLAVVEREARTLSGAFRTASRRRSAPDGPGTKDELDDRKIEMLFLLFGAIYEPETLQLCQRALKSEDRGLQGTALEYLENRLPSHIWGLLRPILAPDRAKPGRKRSPQEIAHDLLAAASSLRPQRGIGDRDRGRIKKLDGGTEAG